ncbi:hypothetical protein TNCV_3003421 [Trichonephila clavipes]|nr:hypothetical protein TNCV_3003421 [Trichonephila clavipes]
MSDISPFPGYFLDDKQYHSLAQISWRLQSDDRLNLLSSENSTHAQSCSVNCDAHDTIANGQYSFHFVVASSPSDVLAGKETLDRGSRIVLVQQPSLSPNSCLFSLSFS